MPSPRTQLARPTQFTEMIVQAQIYIAMAIFLLVCLSLAELAD
jgi:hypothetical protein